MISLLPYALFGIGILIAISGAAKLPDPATGWPDTLGAYAFGIAMAMTGVILWRKKLAQEIAQRLENEKSGDGVDPVSLLSAFQKPAEQFVDEIKTLTAEEITNRVDHLMDHYLLPFAEVRQSIIDRFGMERGADILVTVAFGERLLNRVWSAAADGYKHESIAVLPDAIDALKEAYEKTLATA